jgi:hypothetical protein
MDKFTAEDALRSRWSPEVKPRAVRGFAAAGAGCAVLTAVLWFLAPRLAGPAYWLAVLGGAFTLLGALTSALAGLAGNLAKLGVKVLLELWIGIPTGFLVLGRTYPAATHALFGAAGGYLGYVVLASLRRAGFFAYLAGKR